MKNQTQLTKGCRPPKHKKKRSKTKPNFLLKAFTHYPRIFFFMYKPPIILIKYAQPCDGSPRVCPRLAEVKERKREKNKANLSSYRLSLVVK